jgi:hypothetical protein
MNRYEIETTRDGLPHTVFIDGESAADAVQRLVDLMHPNAEYCAILCTPFDKDDGTKAYLFFSPNATHIVREIPLD